jgi:urease accessory protein
MATAVLTGVDAPQATLRFSRAPDGRTFIARQRVGYPFHVTRPFYLEGDPPGMPTLYLQSVSGGLYQSDDVHMTIEAAADTFSQVTTQAGTIVHGMPLGTAEQGVRIEAAAGSFFEYLPDPLILFPTSILRNRVEIIAAEGATVVATEGFSQHDPKAAGRRFNRFANEIVVRRPGGPPLALERYAIQGDQFENGEISAPWPAQGSFVVITPADAEAVGQAIHEALEGMPGVYAGASALPGGIGVSVRILACDGRALRLATNAAWVAFREVIIGREPPVRRK